MRRMYDAVTPANCPGDGDIYAGYIDGYYQSFGEMVARFPGKIHVPIAVHSGTNNGIVGDMETGDMTPENCVDWVLMRRGAGVHPTIYCSEASWWAVASSFQRRGVAEPEYWIAAYPGNGANLYPGAVAHQYDSTSYDTSVVADFWPGVDTPAPPVEEAMAKSQLIRATDDPAGAVFVFSTQQHTLTWVENGDMLATEAYAGQVTESLTDIAIHPCVRAQINKVPIIGPHPPGWEASPSA